MSIFDNPEIRKRLRSAFPKFFLNSNYEIIIYPARNSYFLMANVDTERDLKAKILEWLSREASKSISKPSQKYHLEGINAFLGTEFTPGRNDRNLHLSRKPMQPRKDVKIY